MRRVWKRGAALGIGCREQVGAARKRGEERGLFILGSVCGVQR